ncbi:hypothetical protein N7471_005588 [Penicillium samsonianum]|uniref:uncharacterized protein n=1 Tax=Penicillium samsonianum TaxID=1882272 RepID=UPI00254945AC|nr:uncharacterized protein N7471_005588 [Penicillium samsonianum]KAJ6139102.1 hypothetical protein N7471_005588 [Penicillium samsonianum]
MNTETPITLLPRWVREDNLAQKQQTVVESKTDAKLPIPTPNDGNKGDNKGPPGYWAKGGERDT